MGASGSSGATEEEQAAQEAAAQALLQEADALAAQRPEPNPRPGEVARVSAHPDQGPYQWDPDRELVGFLHGARTERVFARRADDRAGRAPVRSDPCKAER